MKRKDKKQYMFLEAEKAILFTASVRLDHAAAFKAVKKYIDILDPMRLLEWGAPNDEYDDETSQTVIAALKAKDAKELAAAMTKIFDDAFSEHDLISIISAEETADKIFEELKKTDRAAERT